MIFEGLVNIVGSEHVSDDAEVVAEFSSDPDCSIKRGPECVARPGNVDEVQKIIKWANATSTPLIPVSSGPPHHRGDTIPRMGGVVVDLGQMRDVIRIDRRNRVALVQPGVTFGQLQPELSNEGLKLITPLLPRGNKSVIGSALEREPTLAPRLHWDMSDPLLCMEVVFGGGDVFWTGEAAGPGDLEKQWESGGAQKFPMGPHMVDYHRIIQGSQGTLGITTWASIKCELLPEAFKVLFVTADSIAPLVDLAYIVIQRDLGEEVFLLDRTNLAALCCDKPDDVAGLKEKLDSWTLVIGVNGYEYFPEERLDYQEKDITALAEGLGLEVVDGLPGISGDKMQSVMGGPAEGDGPWRNKHRGGAMEMFFLSTMDRTPGFLDVMEKHAGDLIKNTMDVGVYVQPIVQGTSCHVEFDCFYDPGDPEQTRLAGEWASGALPLLLDAGAFFSRPYPDWAQAVYDRYGEIAGAARKVKGIFDPNDVMNPGKLCY